MNLNNTVQIGDKIYLPENTRYNRFGAERKRAGRIVTVRDVQTDTRSGKTRIFWKSNGYVASTLIAR